MLPLRAVARNFFIGKHAFRALRPQAYSTTAPKPINIEALLSKPSWSVKSLQAPHEGKDKTKISQKQLHHLLRLSALPLPKSPEEEAKMISDLESQLHFVEAIQAVDTTGIEPLQSIRDETLAAQREAEFDMESMKEELAKEEVIGHSRRIRRRESPVPNTQDWDPLERAPTKVGRFIVVDTSKR
jgi:aspartyl/glutamyl-tRNA(Asn/Gln) amidotransferase C subunit